MVDGRPGCVVVALPVPSEPSEYAMESRSEQRTASWLSGVSCCLVEDLEYLTT